MGSILWEPDPVPSSEDEKVTTKFAHLLVEQPNTDKTIRYPHTAKEPLQNQQPAPPASYVLLGRITAGCPWLEMKRSAVILPNCKIHCCLNLHCFALHDVEYPVIGFLWAAEFSTISGKMVPMNIVKTVMKSLLFLLHLGKIHRVGEKKSQLLLKKHPLYKGKWVGNSTSTTH